MDRKPEEEKIFESSPTGSSSEDPAGEPAGASPAKDGEGPAGPVREPPETGAEPGTEGMEIIDLDLDPEEDSTVTAWAEATLEEEEILDLDGAPGDDLGNEAPGEEAAPEEVDRVSLSSRGERDALLASVLRHDAERKQAQATTPHPGPKPLGPQLLALALSTVVAVYVWFGSPAWLSPDPVPLPPLSEEQTSVQAAVWLGTQQVESFQRRNGRVPGIQEVGSLPPGVRYERLDAQSYILVGEGDRVAVSYSSGEPRDDLRAAAGRILEGAESQ